MLAARQQQNLPRELRLRTSTPSISTRAGIRSSRASARAELL